ncbi:MAG: diguanylate cyclase [Syntrophomonadaceae bacterium]|nr:diguanylate cyclase [Syntrophomonadaceae bacterium]
MKKDKFRKGLIINTHSVKSLALNRSIRQPEQVQYNRIDRVTGAINSKSFVEKLHKMGDKRFLPLSIVSLDINGLKLINRSLGYKFGNQVLHDVAKMLHNDILDKSNMFRIGGSQFAIILPSTNEIAVAAFCANINSKIREYNQEYPVFISIAIGNATRRNLSVPIEDVFQQAEDMMFCAKYTQKESFRSSLIRSLKIAAWRHDDLINRHSERMKYLTALMAKKSGLNDKKFSDICLLADLHDIGKIGIPDKILAKPGPLDEEEYEIIKQHCEIGYNIAQEIPELVELAEYILCHHEWWNGQGYPRGLSGERIPLPCRIISIVDAFDAMTNDRPYRKALSTSTAVMELKRMAGKQFDPHLVDIFLDILNEQGGGGC